MVAVRQLAKWLPVLLLAGCATQDQREPTSAGWQTHRAQLAELQQWTASGKLAVRTADTSESASLIWRQHGKDSHLQLSGPLGMGATIIDMDGRYLNIYQGDEHRTLDISTPDAIAQNTGWDLPLLALSYWLKGLPSPDSDLQLLEVDPHTELLRSLQQDGWEVQFEKYGQFQQYILPIRMLIQRDETRVKVVLSNWQVTTP